MFRLLCACIAFGLSVGIVSDVFFLWRWAIGPPPAAVVGLTIIACVWLTVCILRMLSPIENHPGRRSVIPPILFLIPAFYMAWLTLTGYIKLPHGEWDAWAIWNLHARFLYRAGEAWTDMFSIYVFWSHPDYPLLLPSLVASGWTLIGKESVAMPAFIAMMFTFATLALLVSAVCFLWNDRRGLAAGLVFLAAPDFFAHGSYQMADVPLSFFILLTVVLLYLNERVTNGWWLVLAGVSAGFAATTKNEGFLFIVAIVAARVRFGT